jgi:plastocyanin
MKKSQKNTIKIILVVAVLVALAYVAMARREMGIGKNTQTNSSGASITEQSKQSTLPANSDSTASQASDKTAEPTKPLPVLPAKPDHFSTEGDVGLAPDLQVFEVSFGEQGFSPATLNIKQGDIVQFTNNSKSNLKPASNPHPAHTDYPAFVAEQNIAPGDTWQFQFTKVGKWGYHNHLNPSQTGTIVVGQ